MVEISPIVRYLDVNPDSLENANNDRSASGLESYIADYYIKKHVLTDLYPPWVGQAHYNGDLHVHNLTKGFLPYCYGGDLLMLLSQGMKADRIVSGPAKHLDTAVDHIVNYMCTNQQEWAGAQAFSHVNTLLAPFVAYDHLPYGKVLQSVQRLIWNLNFPSRSGYQTVFSNLIFDFIASKHFRELPVVIGGKMTGDTYGDFQDEMDMIHMAYWQIMNGGDAKGNPFTFPIPTVNVTKDTDWDSPLMELIIKNEITRGQAFWMNYYGTGTDPDTLQAMCCHLTLDQSILKQLAPAGGRWAYEGGTGSIGVVTLNLPRIGYLAKEENYLYEKIDELMGKARDILLRKVEIVTASKDNLGLMPLSRKYKIDFNRFFKTIGFVGLDEMLVNYTGAGIDGNIKLAHDILKHMSDIVLEYQQTHSLLFNLEETPAEGCSWRLATKDVKTYPRIFTRGDNTGYFYSALIPPADVPLKFSESVKIGETLLPLLSGGTVYRINMGESQPSIESMKKLLFRLAKNTKIPYYDMNATISICQDCGNNTRGTKDECQACSSHNVKTFTRVVGYYREIQKYNPGKKNEFKTRRYYNI